MMVKFFSTLALFGIALVLFACSESSTEPGIPIGDSVQFHGNSFNNDRFEVSVHGFAVDPVVYSLSVVLRPSNGGLVKFEVQDPNGDPNGLLTLGEHAATGQTFDTIYCGLTDVRMSFYRLAPDQLSVVWESISIGDGAFSGQGYIHLKERINYACVDSINTADGRFGPGDPVYDSYFEMYCEPGFFFPAQKIRFTCENSEIWW